LAPDTNIGTLACVTRATGR